MYTASSRPNHQHKQGERLENPTDFMPILHAVTRMPFLCTCRCSVVCGDVSAHVTTGYASQRKWVKGEI